MSKPWDNEPTPWTDVANSEYGDMSIGIASTLEKRMRAAERLVAEVIAGYEAERDADFDWIAWYENANAHLESAKKEDNGEVQTGN